MQKKAEKNLTDAGKFPIESLRERIARRFGEDAVALSGPCEGSRLVDCVVKQLADRWDKIGERFAGSQRKAVKLAMRLAKSYASKDDTETCVADLQKIGFEKSAASGIADYLKAYAVKRVAMDELDEFTDNIANETEGEDDMGFGEGFGDEEFVEDEGGDEELVDDEATAEPVVEDQVEAPIDGGLGGDEMSPEGDVGIEGMGGEETVTIELPKEVADELMSAISVSSGDDMGMDNGMDADVVELPGTASPEMGGDMLGGLGDEVEGEPTELQEPDGGQVVTGEPSDEPAPAPAEACSGCATADSGKMIDESKPHFPGETPKQNSAHEVLEKVKGIIEGNEHEEGKGESEEVHPEGFEKKLKEKGLDKPEPKKEEKGEKEEGEPKEEKSEDEGEKEEKEASMMLRAGRLRRVGQTLLRLAPEMSLNNTDQLAGGKEIGTAKEKAVEKPEPLPKGNVKPEGFTAGGNKFQDGSTMGKEQKFDAKTVSKEEVSKGEASLMGKDESLPSGGPDVPAGSSPLGNETWQGGDVSTKGTVIATFTPKGLVVETPEGKKFLAKASIKNVTPELVESVGKIPYEGDGRKFATAALKLIRESKCTCEDGVTKTDTSKLEGKNFTNDAEKKPDEGGAVAGKKGSPAKQDEGVTKTDTSKLEATKFTNDEEKKAEAGSDKAVKTAEEKKIKDPQPVDKNLQTEGYSAGDKKFQDGSTMGKEPKFDAKEVKIEDVSKGDASLMGNEKRDLGGIPTDKPEVPAGGGKMGNEQFDGGNVETKGTVIASEENIQKREAEARKKAENEARVREARLASAAALAADMLRHGDISDQEYKTKVDELSQLPVPAIQQLALTIRQTRQKIANKAAVQAETKVASLSVPIISQNAGSEASLVDRLVSEFKLTKQLNALDEMKK